MHTDLDVAQVLEDSAELVFAHGLAKNAIGTPGESQCTVGYLNTAAWTRLGYTLPHRHYSHFMPCPVGMEHGPHEEKRTASAIVDDAIKAIKNVLNLGSYDYDLVITQWSDAPETTPEVARDAYLLAAKEIRNEHNDTD